jgi:hypothetical protein
MPTAEAAIDTPRAARYVAQFGKHARAMAGHRLHSGDPMARDEVDLHVECSNDQVVVTIDPWGRATLLARPDRLVVRAEAPDEQNLRRIQEVLTRNIERFGRRDHLTLTWTGTQPEPSRRRARTPIALGIAGLLGVSVIAALHLGIGGVALALGGVTVAVVALAIGHVAVPIVALRIRRRFIHPERRGRPRPGR